MSVPTISTRALPKSAARAVAMAGRSPCGVRMSQTHCPGASRPANTGASASCSPLTMDRPPVTARSSIACQSGGSRPPDGAVPSTSTWAPRAIASSSVATTGMSCPTPKNSPALRPAARLSITATTGLAP
jgi:hypothetical protein